MFKPGSLGARKAGEGIMSAFPSTTLRSELTLNLLPLKFVKFRILCQPVYQLQYYRPVKDDIVPLDALLV